LLEKNYSPEQISEKGQLSKGLFLRLVYKISLSVSIVFFFMSVAAVG